MNHSIEPATVPFLNDTKNRGKGVSESAGPEAEARALRETPPAAR